MTKNKAETMDIKIDPELKALIPPLSEDELRQLEANLVEHGGARDPLVVWSNGQEAVLVDGHNRHEICTRLGLPYKAVQVSFENPCLARIWIRNNQQGRRNITPAWRIELELGNKADMLLAGRHKKVASGKRARAAQLGVLSLSDKTPIEPVVNTQKEIAKRAKTSVGQVAMAELVKGASPEFWEQCKAGDLGISTAYKQLAKVQKKAKRQKQIEEQKKAIEAGEVKMPEGVYEVVAMDPPWAYGREYDPDGSRVANPYPEMPQAELLKMEPPFASDCVLFLWTTHQFIWDAGELMRKWGFAYKATLVWNKEKMGMGAWLRMQCEFCLIGIRGAPKWSNTRYRDIICEARREHSRKPEAFYEMVESVTVGRRLDYFSREQREGWTAYGNDSSKF